MLQYSHTSGKGFLIDSLTTNWYGVYVPKEIPQFNLNGMFTFCYSWFLFESRKGFVDDLRTAKATPNGAEYAGTIGAQYTFDNRQFTSIPEGLQFSPYASMQYTQVFADGFEEHGSKEFDIEAKPITIKSLVSTLELFIQYSKAWNNFSIMPQIGIGWQRQIMFIQDTFRLRPVGSDAEFLSFTSEEPGPNSAIAVVDLQMYFHRRYGLEASWNYCWNQLYHSNQFYLGFNYLF
jgi:outer membrane autotransporter protein